MKIKLKNTLSKSKEGATKGTFRIIWKISTSINEESMFVMPYQEEWSLYSKTWSPYVLDEL